MKDIQKTIETEIPIVKEMGVEFQEFQDFSCTISAPLAPNHNHKGTAFGGSLYSICTAACYGLMYSLQIKENFHNYDLVIGEGSIRYVRPVEKDFFVKAELLAEDWEPFIQRVQSSGFGKINIKAYVYTHIQTQHLCEYSAVFVLKKIK